MPVPAVLTRNQSPPQPGPTVPVTERPSGSGIDLRDLCRYNSLVSVLACVENLQLDLAGRISCTLRHSLGRLAVFTQPDNDSLKLLNGNWVRAKLLLRRRALSSPDLQDAGACMLSFKPVFMAPHSPGTVWLPTAAHFRLAHMHRLRVLLSQLEPALQAIFLSLMLDERVQRRFFTGLGAADHHCYPGGLFDYCVEAAEQAYCQQQFSLCERGIAALVCLLFDLGKVFDEQFRLDRLRVGSGLLPHPKTQRLIEHALTAVALFDPALVASVRLQLSPCDWTEWLAPPGITPTLKQCVHQALKCSWAFDRPAKDFCTDMGDKK